MKRYIEIRPCAGGTESEQLCELMLNTYKRACDKNSLQLTVIDSNTRMTSLIVEGKNASLFDNEKGVHKFQRIPETEKKGRIQTSTISIAVLAFNDNDNVDEKLFNENDLKIEPMHCQGKGGQNVNKVESGVRITHIPSGITIASTTQRSQIQNKRIAFQILFAKLEERREDEKQLVKNQQRNEQIRSGERSDARRIYNEQRSEIVDKITNQRCPYKEFFKGRIELLN